MILSGELKLSSIWNNWWLMIQVMMMKHKACFKLRIPKKGGALIQVLVMLDQISCEMQLDTGATVSIVPKNLNDKQLNQWPLQCTN